MAQEHPITRLGGWAGYDVVEDWLERRGGQSWCVLRLRAVAGWLRQRSHCGESTRAVHGQQERRVRDLPIFEYRVELIVPRVRVACSRCGRKLQRLSWLEPYARVTRRLGESVAQLCRVASVRHVASFFGLDWKTVKVHKGHRYATVIVEPKGARWLLLKSRDSLAPEQDIQLKELLAAKRALFVVHVLRDALKDLWSYRHTGYAERAWRQLVHQGQA